MKFRRIINNLIKEKADLKIKAILSQTSRVSATDYIKLSYYEELYNLETSKRNDKVARAVDNFTNYYISKYAKKDMQIEDKEKILENIASKIVNRNIIINDNLSLMQNFEMLILGINPSEETIRNYNIKPFREVVNVLKEESERRDREFETKLFTEEELKVKVEKTRETYSNRKAD